MALVYASIKAAPSVHKDQLASVLPTEVGGDALSRVVIREPVTSSSVQPTVVENGAFMTVAPNRRWEDPSTVQLMVVEDAAPLKGAISLLSRLRSFV